ncbi:MAG: 5-methylcytosine-specific restriction enzyme [Bradyrhizobium sp.]|jgi:MoxR-like ATPase|nr:5-methylcytosine-specific restriction enzyme [Bradyrhizobium sp.]
MRDFDDVAPQLQSLAANQPLVHAGRDNQRLTDLRFAKIVQPGDNALTNLGHGVLQEWLRYGVADNDVNHELARQLILILEAIRLREGRYLEFYRYWEDLSATFGAENLLENWDKLYILNYLDFERGGFTPGALLRAAKVPLASIDSDLEAVARSYGASADAIAGATKVATALNAKITRGRHRATFCLAMELTRSDLARSDALLERFGYPDRPAWRILPVAAREICHQILRASGKRLSVAELTVVATPVLKLLEARKNVILYGPPGTGKTRAAMATADVWRSRYGPDAVFEVTFHPSYGYEDFVWGFRPKDGTFAPTPGVLLAACDSAKQRPTLMLIDEVNRADTSRVFGELITYIEPDKRNRSFRLAQDPATEYSIPSDLFFLGTMNTADRSVSLLDVALRRRFAFIEYAPSTSAFEDPSWLKDVAGVSLPQLMLTINSRLAAIGVEPDRAIGHAILHVGASESNPTAALRDRFQYDVYPLVVDYCFTDRKKVYEVLQPLVGADGSFGQSSETDFIEALKQLVPAPFLPGA